MASRAISRDSAVEMSRFCASANFRRAARVVTHHYDAALRASGITATQLPLLAAIGTGTNASITALAEALDLERSTVSRELDTLHRLGLIATKSSADRRATALKLTARGERVLKAAHRAWQEAHDAIISAYGRQPYETLIASTRELGRRVDALAKPSRRRRAVQR
jgi:DNA-binding MarR family transcriptional regulator